MMRRGVEKISAAVCLAVWATSMPVAAADPGAFPDLGSYSEANTKDYYNYYNYPTTGGIQFLGPGGYRCRMSFTGKADVMQVSCWGALPGTSANAVGMNYVFSRFAPASFSHSDLAATESYETMGDNGTVERRQISPDAYKPLPAHSKVIETSWKTGPVATCGVDAAQTACVIEDSSSGQRHGFVLSPQGNSTF